uniref:Uncharacterized protein n=1 Tax=Pristhesancus plagipennis TaxID=1955184 RepID=A0A2K8JUS2_PRIPG|nr:secreted hypothetical protein [Pristhesancus plagipennis]
MLLAGFLFTCSLPTLSWGLDFSLLLSASLFEYRYLLCWQNNPVAFEVVNGLLDPYPVNGILL